MLCLFLSNEKSFETMNVFRLETLNIFLNIFIDIIKQACLLYGASYNLVQGTSSEQSNENLTSPSAQ